MKKKVMVFGTFDGIHKGHKAFLKEAKKKGNYLIVVLPADNMVKQLKGRLPNFSLAKRIEGVTQSNLAHEVVVGDATLGSWKVVERYRPHIIALGHDQVLIRKELEKLTSKFGRKLEFVVVKKFEI